MWWFPVLFCIFKGKSQIEKATIFKVTVVVITDVVAPKKIRVNRETMKLVSFPQKTSESKFFLFSITLNIDKRIIQRDIQESKIWS